MLIIWDSRGESPGQGRPNTVVAVLTSMGHTVERGVLAGGDYATFEGASPVVVSRKTIGDFYQSMNDRRLEQQSAAMILEYGDTTKLAVLIEGEWENILNYTTAVRFNAFIAGLQGSGLDIWLSPSQAETAKILSREFKAHLTGGPAMLRRYIRKKAEVFDSLGDPKQAQIAKLLDIWDRLPEKIAMGLIERHGTVAAVLSLRPEKLLGPGLQRGSIDRLWSLLGRPPIKWKR